MCETCRWRNKKFIVEDRCTFYGILERCRCRMEEHIMRVAGLSIVSALFILTSCTVVVDESPRPAPPYRDPGPACTMQYDPVCGERRGVRQTYGNECIARAERARIIHAGECRFGGGGGQMACTREYAPVCATRRGTTRSFGNACEAESAGYRIIYPGQC